MRAFRLRTALFIMLPIFLLAFGESSFAPRLLAQVTAQTGPAPLTPPAAPGQPNSFATIGALPALAPAPGSARSAIAAAAPTPRVFRCTCSAPGNPTEWAGTVFGSSYLQASRAAGGQCLNYILNSNAPSPYVAPPSGAINQRPPVSIGSAYNSRAQIAAGAGGSQPLNVFKGQVAGECAQCACN